MNLTEGCGAKVLVHQIPKRVLLHFNSRTVVMEVETR